MSLLFPQELFLRQLFDFFFKFQKLFDSHFYFWSEDKNYLSVAANVAQAAL